MMYQSLNNKKNIVNFHQAVINGLASDDGLYYPINIPIISNNIISNISNYEFYDIALQIMTPYIKDSIPKNILINIIKETIKIPFIINHIYDNIYSLELFHGPTLAFKDVGTKFMACCLDYFQKKDNNNNKITVLVATSGDTGAAVANGFYNMDNINVVILYPSKGVSNIQEKQITTLGKNIKSLEINGSFDDCQNLVKQAFLDKDLRKNIKLTSANSINIGRLIPQILYYFYAFQKLTNINHKNLIFSVPSGNFGNICAGIIAKKMGLPIHHFISSTNINDTIPRYLKTGKYIPKKTYTTISNAMDISNPSNFIRIKKLYNNDFNFLKKEFSSYAFTDNDTLKSIIEIQNKYKYIMDPHGAVGYLGLKKYLNKLSNNKKYIGIFLETAHPIKFINIMPKDIQDKIIYPSKILELLNKKILSIKLDNNYNLFKRWLLNNR